MSVYRARRSKRMSSNCRVADARKVRWLCASREFKPPAMSDHRFRAVAERANGARRLRVFTPFPRGAIPETSDCPELQESANDEAYLTWRNAILAREMQPRRTRVFA